MAERRLTLKAPADRRWAGLPAALRIGILYVAARFVTTGFLLLAAHLAGPGSRFGEDATLSHFILGWDAQWYWLVALEGYPSQLPLTDTGQVAENQWAFMPVFAYLAQLLGGPLRAAGIGGSLGPWGIGALTISLVAGYLACLVLYRVLRDRQDAATATWAALFFAAGPLSVLFQVGYAESLFLLWLMLSLWCVQRRRYGWLYLLIPLMGYTRPGVLAFALFLGIYGVWRWFSRRREPLGAGEVLHILALGALAVLVGFSWQVLAGWVTGDSGAYLATELAWRRSWIRDSTGVFVPFDGWIQGAAFWSGVWGLGAGTGYVVLALLGIGLAGLLLFEPHVKSLGVEVRLWAASYLLYLLAVFFPQSSLFRLLLPLSPLWGAVAAPRSTVYRVSVLALCLIGQWWWIYNMYALGNTYWQIP
ncbi:mannosyltransferase family protein [Microbacterium sp. DT81.1]|uniref:mannosyltransferase family protein n=1 Tax=Microbacterium sp. DT81.1 TaxID=3393413 RepID=UPI003CE6C5D3